ncbi:MAG: Ran-binding zinc finger domain-containing protein [Actinomycetota bacterium]
MDTEGPPEETEGRCPNCGALVSPDAEWCNLCFASLKVPEAEVPDPTQAAAGPSPSDTGPASAADLVTIEVDIEEVDDTEPPAPEPAVAGPAPGSQIAEREAAEEEAAASTVWQCPVCDEENPLEANTCMMCGTPFGRLFEEPEEQATMEPNRAAMLGLLPGLGHYKLGRGGEGFARAFAFAGCLGMALLFLLSVSGTGSSRLLILSLYFIAVIFLIGESAMECYRIASGEPQLIPGRLLIWGFVAVFGLSVVLVVALSLGVRPETSTPTTVPGPPLSGA